MNPFKDIDNISMFTHPKFNKNFRYMDEKASVELAKRIYQEFKKSKYKNIIIIESGTSPLINIINRIRDENELCFYQIKIPRDLNFNLMEWFLVYLSSDELNEIIDINKQKKTRRYFLEQECNTFKLSAFVSNGSFTIYDSILDKMNYDYFKVKAFNEILKGTKLYNIFQTCFLVFDEYINAGTIIRNINGMIRLFNFNPTFKLSAFCMFLDNPDKFDKIAFTIYDNSSELSCYENGSYPFENRVDLIGYYYFVDSNNFKKIYLENIKNDLVIDEHLNTNNFYRLLYDKINDTSLLDILKNNLQEEQNKNFVSIDDIMRYILKLLDKKIYGSNEYYDLLDQVFEMYAPAWSPMPTLFHLDYWNGFEKSISIIEKMADNLINEYLKYRFNIISEIIDNLITTRNKWEQKVARIIEEEI